MKRHVASLAVALLSLPCVYGAEFFVNGSAGNDTEDGSQSAPYKTIKKALAQAKNGDTITVAQGIYRENVFMYGKKGDQPLVIKAAKDARPVISGFKILNNWTQDPQGLYTTTVDFKPQGLLLNGQYQTLVRYPETGWLRKLQPGKDKNVFTAKVERDIPVGTEAYIWYCNNNLFGQVKIKECPQKGTFVMEPNRGLHHKNLDQVFFRNHPGLITKSGQWAWRQLDKKKYQIFLKWDAPIADSVIEVGGQHIPLMIRVSKNIHISGFDIMGSRDAGVEVAASENISLTRLGLFWNSCGTYVRACKQLAFEDCRFSANMVGAVTIENTDIAFRKCDVGFNCDDGIRITWKTRNAVIEACRVHHHFMRGHPDNTQFYRDVNGVLMKDNLYFNSEQGIMSEQAKNFTFDNNIFICSSACLLILANQDTILKNNTAIFGGYGAIRCAGERFNFSNNIIQGMQFNNGPHADRKYVGSNNLYLTPKPNYWHWGIDNKWPWTFDEFLKISKEQNSSHQVTPVPGMPADMAVINETTVCNATKDTFQLRGNANFKLGDIVEIDFDGVPRTIVAVAKKTITVKPALKYPPSNGFIVLNWKNQKDLAWKPQFSKKAGASVPWEDIRLDRYTTVPMPANVQHFIDNISALTIW